MNLRRSSAGSGAGFTLLEVMVAVAVLGISLTAIFSSQAGAIRMASRSGKMGMAALLARCKMGEIEEQVANEGLPAIFDSGSDNCCEDAELEGYSCRWEINPVILPDSMFAPEDEDGEPLDGQPAAEPAAPSAAVPLTAATTSPEDILAGGADMGGLASTALNFVYPVLKPSFESQIRRATVTVVWTEGQSEHSFDVTQYLVDNTGVPLDESLLPGGANNPSTNPSTATPAANATAPGTAR